MDISSTLIGLGLLLLFISPIFILIYKQNQKQRDLKKLLFQKANEYGINPDITDLSPSLLLGLDSKLKNLLIIVPAKSQSHSIPLSEIVKCELKTLENKDLADKIKYISLFLFYRKKENPPIEIVFHDDNDEVDSQEEVRLILAKKWETLIKQYYTDAV